MGRERFQILQTRLTANLLFREYSIADALGFKVRGYPG
jgi:hypothetical protein